MARNKISEAFPTLLTDGAFFNGLSIFNNSDFSLSKANAGLAYFARSGGKTVTSLVQHFEDDDGVVTSQGLIALSGMLDQLYAADWTRILEALYAEYDPLSNYDMAEDGADTKTGADTITDTIAQRQLTRKHGAQKEEYTSGDGRTEVQHPEVKITKKNGERRELIDGGQDTREHQVAAFNSVTYQAGTKDIDIIEDRTNVQYESEDEDITAEHTEITIEDERVDKKEADAFDDVDIDAQHEDTHETEYDSGTEHHLTRKGNIGVTTSQQLILSELELRKNNFYERMFADIDKYLALACYS